MSDIDDPRVWSAAAPSSQAAELHALAAASLGAATAQDSDRHDAKIVRRLRALLDAEDGGALAALFDAAPGAAVYRHLWRLLTRAEGASDGDALRATVFALPVVVVAALADGAVPQTAPSLPGVLPEAGALAALLRKHGALAGNRTFALGNALVDAEALGFARMPRLLARRALDAGAPTPLDLAPAPIVLAAGHESVHLRFIVGVAVAAPGVDLLADESTQGWGIPLTQALGAQVAVPGTTVLALPHAPQRLVTAVQTGRALQREVSAQVFAGNALRKFRASVGEPSAVISAHRVAGVPTGGELRLSLSSPFEPRDAEGFRCPLYAADRTADVVQMLTTLLADCRVGDVRVLPGVHADRDPATDVPLLFKADALH